MHLLYVSSADRITFQEGSKRLQCIGEEQDAFLERDIFLLPFLFTASGSKGTKLIIMNHYFILFHNIAFTHPVALVCSRVHS